MRLAPDPSDKLLPPVEAAMPADESPSPSHDDTSDDDMVEVEGQREGTDRDDDELLDHATPVQPQSCVWIEIPTFFYFLALSTTYPIVQFYLYDYFSHKYGWQSDNDTDQCSNNSQANNSDIDKQDTVQEFTNRYVMYMNFISNFCAVVPTLLLGALTDKLGRNFVFSISFLGLFLSEGLILAVFFWNLAPEFLFISSFLQGMSGSYGLFLAAVFGVIADVTSLGKQRAVRVTTTEGAIAIASSVATTTSGIWINKIGYFWPLLFSLGCVVLAAFYVIIFIPETLIQSHRRPVTCKSLSKCFQFYIQDTPEKRRFKLIVCLICFLIMLTAYVGDSNIYLLYLLHEPFCWPKMWITIFSGLSSLVKWVVVISATPLGRLLCSEPVFATLGVLSAAAGYFCKGLARGDDLIYIGMGVSIMSEFVHPMARTMMSKAVSADEQGALFAGIGVLQMIVSTVSGIALSAIYAVGLKVFLGLPYLVLTGLLLFAFFLLILLIIRNKLHPELEDGEVSVLSIN